ncbi:Tn3 family transposase, partial [Aeromonas veronii]|uniref:Tn3 family transposase n=1 Tax=Aeromonas veronii TaxID=654 RepID=UPI00406CD6D6
NPLPDSLIRDLTAYRTLGLRLALGEQPDTYRALSELGRAVKTIFLCRYLRQEPFRREINEGLNVVENWNSANGFVFF